MTDQEIRDAVKASGLTASELTSLLKQGKNTIMVAKLQAELGGLEQQRLAAIADNETLKQAKQAQIAAAQRQAALDFGVEGV